MTDETIKNSDARVLWRRFRREPEPPQELGDWQANALAAALEGTLSETEAERLEASLDGSPALLEIYLAASEDADAGDPAPPQDLIERAKALAANGAGAERVALPRPANENRRPWRARTEWAAVAAAIVIIAGVGFELGADTGRGAKKIQISMAGGAGLGFEFGGQFGGRALSASFSVEEFDDAFSRGEI